MLIKFALSLASVSMWLKSSMNAKKCKQSQSCSHGSGRYWRQQSCGSNIKQSGFFPRLVNGRPIKSINQYYNKQREQYQKKMSKNHHTSRELERITNKRTRRIDHYMHTTSRRIIDLLDSRGHRHAHHWQKSVLEARPNHAQEGQAALCPIASCPFHRHALLQSQVGWHPGCCARRKLYQQSQFS